MFFELFYIKYYIIVNEFIDINATVHHIMEVYGWAGEGMDHAWTSMHIMRVNFCEAIFVLMTDDRQDDRQNRSHYPLRMRAG